MSISTSEFKYFTPDNAKKQHPLTPLLGKLAHCVCKDGYSFVSRLTEIRGNKLYFETSSGDIKMNDLDSLVSIREFKPKKAVI